MNEPLPIPESISHKKLNKFLSHAKKDTNSTSKDISYKIDKKEKLKESLQEWSISSKKLLAILRQNEKSLTEIKNSKSILALGAMEAHINMAMQALKASEEES
ncbi:MATH domain-containing protein [Prochlorococcus marinus]|uniref:MATH domain-containing protein n=1 Tax=Prochlorococcus marinus TaxID=1219 RepID=UPI0022B5330E|nr:MATH domain-containing protein [Prochlorococcus marinus]